MIALDHRLTHCSAEVHHTVALAPSWESSGLAGVCNIPRDLAHIIVELVIAAFASPNNRVRNRVRVQVNMSDGHNLVLSPVIEEDGGADGEAFCKVCARPDVIAWPSALADKRRSNEK
jgi:hypothetical protein